MSLDYINSKKIRRSFGKIPDIEQIGIHPDTPSHIKTYIEDIEHADDEFAQANRSRDEALGGTGIGLALSRRLVELHGGESGVTSEDGQGSKFWFTLPHKKVTENKKVPEIRKYENISTNPTGKSILVVEDNQTNLDMIKYLLGIHNHKISVARNGKEAISQAELIEPE